MSEKKFLKCICSQCGGHIEFPADGIGLTVPCPHCGWQTELTLDAPETIAARPPRRLKWVIAGAVILAVGLVGAVGALMAAQYLIKKARAQRVAAMPARVGRTNTAAPAVPVSTAMTNLNGFSASAVKIEKTPGSTLAHAVVTLKNLTDERRFSVTVEMDLLDSGGKKLGTAKDYKDIIEPHAQWTFRALLVQKNVAAAVLATVEEK